MIYRVGSSNQNQNQNQIRKNLTILPLQANRKQERGKLRKIGSLTPEPTKSGPAKGTPMTKSNGSPMGCETGRPESANQTGTGPSTTGSSPKSATVPSISAGSLSILNGLSTTAANRALAALCKDSAVLAPRFSENLTMFAPVAYTATGPDLATARAVVEQSLTPSDPETVRNSLAAMAAMVKMTGDDGETEAFRMRVYARKLAEYPADAVDYACQRWCEHNVFWPAWAELRDLLEARVAERRMMLAALS